MRSDSRKREESNTFPADRRPHEVEPSAMIQHGDGNNLKSLASVPEETYEDGKDNLRTFALYRKHANKLTLHQTDP